MHSLTFFLVTPLFVVLLLGGAFVCAPGLFFLLQRLLLSPGPLALLRLFFFLLGEGCFLFGSLRNWEEGAWVHVLTRDKVRVTRGERMQSISQMMKKTRRVLPTTSHCQGPWGCPDQVYRVFSNIPHHHSLRGRLSTSSPGPSQSGSAHAPLAKRRRLPLCLFQ